MKLNKRDFTFSAVMMLALSTQSNAGTMGTQVYSTPGKVYLSVFGGAGASDTLKLAQYGTAFFPPVADGPLAVNAFGSGKSGTVGIAGGHIGYQWSDVTLNLANSLVGITPATELEGYYLGKANYIGHELNNETHRLVEHDFLVTYPTTAGIYLVNTVINFNLSEPLFKPYVGAGIGAAVLSISNATSTQTVPAEVGINHYNSDRDSTDSVFAGQVKAGLSVNFTPNFSMFGEYRWLYLANSDYNFGSTSYVGHVPTSSWAVKFDSQNYNLGAVGLRYTI